MSPFVACETDSLNNSGRSVPRRDPSSDGRVIREMRVVRVVRVGGLLPRGS